MDAYQETKSASAVNIIPFTHIAWARLVASQTDGMMTVELLTASGWNSIDLPKEEAISFVNRFKQSLSSKVG